MTTKIVGILNITPDSFSDGGKFVKHSQAISHLQKMLNEGVAMVDIGAESTRPNATAISSEEELQRLEKIVPQIVAIVEKFNCDNSKQVEISIDTYHTLTAKRVYEQGVKIINDVSGLKDLEMVEFIAQKNIKTIFMHSLCVPANPDIIINKSLNVTSEILQWAVEKIADLAKNGIKKSQLIFDPGIGFSKDANQSLKIIKHINDFRQLGLPIYVGHSKKSFLDALKIEGLSNNKESRSQKTLIISKYLAAMGVDYIRVHDVLENKNAIAKKENSPITL